MSSFKQKCCFFIEHIDFSLEKCRFGAKKGVSHYVLARQIVILPKKDNLELEICVKAIRTHGTAARSPPVAEMIASEARHTLTSGHVSARQERVRRPLSIPFPGRSIERVLRDLATPSNKDNPRFKFKKKQT